LGAPAGLFAEAGTWQAQLAACGVTGVRPVRIATAGALLGSLVAHGVSPDWVVLSAGAPQFDVLVQASCWLHAERPWARLGPFGERHREAIAGVRQHLWELYQDRKAYRQLPQASHKAVRTPRFDAWCAARTGYPSVDAVRTERAAHRADLLRVLERPEVPFHPNVSESHLREYMTKRKVSGGTRSGPGRRCRDTFTSLQKTCRCLGVNFWEYVQDRVRGRHPVPQLAELVRRASASRGGVVAALA
jgi:Transposase IS66 family/FAD binding domain of DNA photolyase